MSTSFLILTYLISDTNVRSYLLSAIVLSFLRLFFQTIVFYGVIYEV